MALLSLVLAGCGKVDPVHHLPPQVAPGGCDEIITFGARLPFPASPLQGPPEPGAQEAWQIDPSSDPVGLKLLDALGQTPTDKDGVAQRALPVSESVLIISGGSQQGAFGAGFMSAWEQHRGGSLPRFKLVTGISTGALQATFAFLGDTKTIVEEYSITSESELLKPLVRGKFEQRPVRAAISLTRAGTLARLQPLRDRLMHLINEDVLVAVAREAKVHQRTLLVGAVEMGSGEMAVFDLTKAALLYVENLTSHPDRAKQMRGCYIEALLASSSVPMSAAPVFIDNRLYIDGGARFGVLVDLTANAFRRKVAEARALERAADVPRNLFVIVNATLEVPAFCGLTKCAAGDDGQAVKPPRGHAASGMDLPATGAAHRERDDQPSLSQFGVHRQPAGHHQRVQDQLRAARTRAFALPDKDRLPRCRAGGEDLLPMAAR
ncbi:MAG: hypothetical protein OHK0018_01510 [Erythrobacter tepidarius]